jgi:hypothetical protein
LNNWRKSMLKKEEASLLEKARVSYLPLSVHECDQFIDVVA